MRFTPRGLVDAFDASDKFPGASQKLSNLIFDQSNPELVVSRPGVTLLVDLAATGRFASPTFISIHIAIGTRIYGMVATLRFPGHDEPFCYDTATSTFIPISGVTALTTPLTPALFGDWVPPTMTSVGTLVIVTHAGFSGLGKHLWGDGTLWGSTSQGGSNALWGDAYTFGTIDTTVPNALVWNSTTTAVNPLDGVPTAVANFNNRAWFAVRNQLEYTDVLTNPLTRTNATQAITIGDSGIVNALSGLPVQTAGSGIVQTLTVFKSTQVWQVGGDPATWNLGLDQISLTVGTNAPRSIGLSPYGTYFGSTGGPYFIDLLGALRPLTNSLQTLEPDVQTPFENAFFPTRWAGAYNSTIYRVCGGTTVRGISSVNDYWFDEHKRRWNGPHTFQYDCASALGGFFVLSSVGNPGLLMQSNTQQNMNFVNTDLGTLMTCTMLSSTFPKVGDMFVKQVAESQIELSASSGNITYNITAQDEQGRTIGFAQISVINQGAAWGSFNWGDGTLWSTSNLWGGGSLWGALGSYWGDGTLWLGNPPAYWTAAAGSGVLWGAGVQNVPHTYPVPWAAPLVFEKMQLLVTATASAEVGIGTFYARYQKTGYMTTGQQ
jgi:hypothetical protein